MISDPEGILHHHLIGLFLAEISKFLQHLLSGTKIKRWLPACIRITLRGHEDAAGLLILRIQEMDVAGGADGNMQGISQPYNGAVEVPELFFVTGSPFLHHKLVVSQRLDLQKIVEAGDGTQFLPRPAIHNCTIQFPLVTGAAEKQPLLVLQQLAFGDAGLSIEVMQMRPGNQLIQVFKPCSISRQDRQMKGPSVCMVLIGNVIDIIRFYTI